MKLEKIQNYKDKQHEPHTKQSLTFENKIVLRDILKNIENKAENDIHAFKY